MNDKPLTIAMLSIHSSPIGTLGTKDTGGMSIYVRELARQLGERNHSVDIFTHENAVRHPTVMDLCHNVRLVHLKNGGIPPRDKKAFLSALPHYFQDFSMFKDCHHRQYDLVHSHYWLSGPLGVWAQEAWDVPHLITFHTLGEVKNEVGGGMQEPSDRITTEQSLVASCRRILSATVHEKNQLQHYYGAAADKVGIVPCGVDVSLFAPREREGERKKLGVRADDVVLLYVGRFDKLKGLEQLFEALSLAHTRHTITLIVVGGDEKDNHETFSMQRFCRERNIEKIVRFCGPVDHRDLPGYYSAADALIIPSLYESFSLVALEAMACGTPVLATRVGAMESLIDEGRNGSIIAGADPRSLAKAIDVFVEQISSAPFSREAIRQSAQRFTWDNATTALLNEYSLVSKC